MEILFFLNTHNYETIVIFSGVVDCYHLARCVVSQTLVGGLFLH